MVAFAPFASSRSAPADGASACTIRLGKASLPIRRGNRTGPNRARGKVPRPIHEIIACAIKQDHENECLPGSEEQQKCGGHQRAGCNHRLDRVIAFAEKALNHSRADLRRSEYGAETYRRREVNAPGLQENQQMDDDDRADPGGNREHEREKTENQGFIVYP
jgi:hypothetical protein